MAWISPPDFAAGTVVTETDLDALSNDLMHLLNARATATVKYVGSADRTSTSNTFADVDATNVIISLTPNSTRVLVTFTFCALAGSTDSEFDIYSVGLSARLGHATNGLAVLKATMNAVVTISGLATGLTAGASQSFKLQFRSVTNGQTTTVYNNAVVISAIAREV